MNEGRGFFELPQAETVPANSRYVVEMGDGTGTKSITHENMVKAVGANLPLGNMKHLETVAKGSIVDAINEIKHRIDSVSGGAMIKILTEDPGLYGRVVLVTDGENTVAGAVSYTGECVIAGVFMNGNLTVSSSTEEGATDECVIYVDAYATYTVELDTRVQSNWINIQTPEESLYGCTVSASNEAETETAVIGNDGRARIKFLFSGNVTVSATDGQNVVNTSVEVSGEGTGNYDVLLRLYHITVTTQEAALEGKSATLTRGNHVRKGVFEDGIASITCDDHFIGECEISAVDGILIGSEKINISNETYDYSAVLVLRAVYSALIDYTKSDPTEMVTYADNTESMEKGFHAWRDQRIFKEMRPCVMKDGEVLYYLNPDNYEQKEDGTNADITTLGNDVMLEIPLRIGYSIEWQNEEKTLLKVSVTDAPNDPEFKYDAFSLDSYNDCDRIYIGAYKGHCSGEKAYSSSGKDVTTTQTLNTFRAWCRARGAGYQQRTYGSLKLMQCLYIISHGTLNSQSAVGMGYVQSSHRNGVPTGGTNLYGYNSEIIRESNPSYMTDQEHQVKCLGLEDFWGNFYEFIDGVVTDSNWNIMTCDCAKSFNSDGEGYKNNGDGGLNSSTGVADDNLKCPQGGSDAGFTIREGHPEPRQIYHCDTAQIYQSSACYFGGGFFAREQAGAFAVHLAYRDLSLKSGNICCRLMYMHKEQI